MHLHPIPGRLRRAAVLASIAMTAVVLAGSGAALSSTAWASPASAHPSATVAAAIESPATATFTEGVAGQFTVTTIGTPTPAIDESGALPEGVTFVDNGDGTATLAGSPAVGSSGQYPITVTAGNGTPPDAVQNFSLTVLGPPLITSDPSALFRVGIASSYTLTASGVPTPQWSVAGNLPSGVTLSSAGVLAGTPAAGTGGVFQVTVTASNATPPDATQLFDVIVYATPVFTSAATATFTATELGGFTVTAVGYPTPTFSEVGTLPAGVTLSAQGLLGGTPAAGSAGDYPVTLVAQNQPLADPVNGPVIARTPYPVTADQSFTLVVSQAPVLGRPTVGGPRLAVTPTGQGYWEVTPSGHITASGDAHFYGDTTGIQLNAPVVGIASTPDGRGYWLVGSDGGVFAFGDAAYRGSTGGIVLNRPVVGITSSQDGNGYWLVASDGGIFAFGDAAYHGSPPSLHRRLNSDVVGMAATTTGGGYWIVASDGGVFCYGDAAYAGSAAGFPLNEPVVGLAPTPDGAGYWMVASDGGIFAFGDAAFHGTTATGPLTSPIIGMFTDTGATTAGYTLVGADGTAHTFGS